MWGEIIYPFPNLNGCTVEVWEGMSISVPYFMMDAITYYSDLTLLQTWKWTRVLYTIE